MTTRLVILGLLRERPLYGYEIKQLIEERGMEDWTSIAYGSIYFALGKLADERFIENVAVEQQGNRPSRSVYQITDAGRKEFLRLLREVWGTLDWPAFDIEVAVYFMAALPRAELVAYLRQRVEGLTGAIDKATAERDDHMRQPKVPRVVQAIFSHGLTYLRGELAWTEDLLAQVEAGELP
ncbi:MAG: PadR family transcriptional regulator [Anaerolineae bacterium]|nr:PadR family transcriptional regulator [Anaerolineae bacterium]